MTKARTLMLMIGAIALILVLLALQLLYPGERRLTDTRDGASISFAADRGMVAAPGACVLVRWQVDHIREVYLNGVPTVGAGEQRLCVAEASMPLLHVKFDDGSAADYRLTIEFLIEQPATWLLLSAAALLGLLSLGVALSRPRPSGSSSASRPAARASAIFATLGATVVALAALALLLELGMRFYFTRFGTELERIAYVYSRAEIDALTNSTIPLPYVEYGLSPGYKGHNRLGYRGEEIQVPKPPGVYRIVALGGSTTYGTATPPDQTYPYFLQQVLRDEYGYDNVEVVNGGVAGYTSWNILVDLALRVPELQPNLVIFYEATNDVLTREVPPECYNQASPFLGLDPRRLVRATPGDLSPSTLYRFVAIRLGRMKNPTDLESIFADNLSGCGGMAGTDVAHNVEVNRPIYFERNERDMVALASANGFTMMFAGWAYDHNSADALPFWRTAVEEHNAITARVAQATGALYFDYAAVAPVTDDSYWSDYVHMNAKGNLDQARAFARFLADQGVIEKSSG